MVQGSINRPAAAFITASVRVVAPSLARALSIWKSTLRARHAREPCRDDGREQVEVDRLGDVVVGAEAPSLELAVAIGERRQEHERHAREARRQRDQALEQLEPGHQRHVDVAEHEIGRVLQDRGQACVPVIGDAERVAALDQLLDDQRGGLAIVLDAQDSFGWLGHGTDPVKAF